MTNKQSEPTEEKDLSELVRSFVLQALANGADPAGLSYALAVEATRMGLDLAPNNAAAFAVVMKAITDSAFEKATADHKEEASNTEHVSMPPVASVH